jgi:hypothetical protein
MRLPRPDKSGLAMTKSEGLDESGNYKNLDIVLASLRTLSSVYLDDECQSGITDNKRASSKFWSSLLNVAIQF